MAVELVWKKWGWGEYGYWRKCCRRLVDRWVTQRIISRVGKITQSLSYTKEGSYKNVDYSTIKAIETTNGYWL